MDRSARGQMRWREEEYSGLFFLKVIQKLVRKQLAKARWAHLFLTHYQEEKKVVRYALQTYTCFQFSLLLIPLVACKSIFLLPGLQEERETLPLLEFALECVLTHQSQSRVSVPVRYRFLSDNHVRELGELFADDIKVMPGVSHGRTKNFNFDRDAVSHLSFPLRTRFFTRKGCSGFTFGNLSSGARRPGL